MVFQDSLARLEEMDFLESGDSPALLARKATQGRMVSREKLVYPAQRATKEGRGTWDLLEVLVLGANEGKLDPSDLKEKKDHLD